MIDALQLLGVLLAGIALGGVFFGGLWWTLRHTLSHGATARRPTLWLPVSWLVRMGVVLLGFYVMADGHPAAPAMGLVGFLMARFGVLRATRPAPALTEANRHAP